MYHLGEVCESGLNYEGLGDDFTVTATSGSLSDLRSLIINLNKIWSPSEEDVNIDGEVAITITLTGAGSLADITIAVEYIDQIVVKVSGQEDITVS